MRHPPVKELIDIPRMADIAQRMLRDALDAFVRRDIALAQRVLNEDDALDALKTQVFRELLTYMLQDPHTIEPSLDLILISRHLERIGDHATNVAEDVIFMVSARDVRHHAGEVEAWPYEPRSSAVHFRSSRTRFDTMSGFGASPKPSASTAGASRSTRRGGRSAASAASMADLGRWLVGGLPRAREQPGRRCERRSWSARRRRW